MEGKRQLGWGARERGERLSAGFSVSESSVLPTRRGVAVGDRGFSPVGSVARVESVEVWDWGAEKLKNWVRLFRRMRAHVYGTAGAMLSAA